MLITKKYRFSNEKLLPNSVRIVFVSDLHVRKKQERSLIKVVEAINSQNPDIVVLGGDFVKGDFPQESMEPEKIAAMLGKIQAKYGAYAVLGNHDRWYDSTRVAAALKEQGIILLENDNKKIDICGKSLYIAGVEDIMTGKPDYARAFLNTSSPVILVSHSPDIFPEVAQSPFLILCGHLHGGQVRLPFIGSLVVPSKYGNRYSLGLFEEKGKKMIVSKGVGTSLLNLRFNCLPEIVLIEIN